VFSCSIRENLSSSHLSTGKTEREKVHGARARGGEKSAARLTTRRGFETLPRLTPSYTGRSDAGRELKFASPSRDALKNGTVAGRARRQL
jgi:hypothetical protein